MKKLLYLPVLTLLIGTAGVLFSGCSPEAPIPPSTVELPEKPVQETAPEQKVEAPVDKKPETTEPVVAKPMEQLPVAGKNFSYAYWLNGWRKDKGDTSDDILCFETGHYGLTIDLSDFEKTTFGFFSDATDYIHALRADTGRMNRLTPAELAIEVNVDGQVYRAVTCKSGIDDANVKKLRNARLWESGQLTQHFDLLGLIFRNKAGEELPCDATLDIVVWPGSLTFNLELAPEHASWANAAMRIRLNDWTEKKTIPGNWETGKKQTLTFTRNFTIRERADQGITIQCSTPDNQRFPVKFNTAYNCYAAIVGKGELKRNWETGYTDIRNYDEFDIEIENGSTKTSIPFLLDLSNPANITGLCPVLCREDGTPTGIPVQLSKNWHHEGLGAYLRAFALIPAGEGTTRYKLRIAYGFYGTLPSASHAQLSLVGYGRSEENGNNGRWDQLAIGCWGETICFDMDMSCVDNVVTDVRMLMTRNGRNGRMWTWTDAGWGGDWLNLRDDLNLKLYPTELKTAYASQGPCLTEVHYDGYYGSRREVDMKATVRTLRTDDYARTFQTFTYTFTQPVSAENGWLFKMGKTPRLVVPEVAYGNKAGLIKEHKVPVGLNAGEIYQEQTELTGSAPWWVAFPGSYHENTRDWGTGCRGLVIRSYEARISGTTYRNPTISFPVYKNVAADKINLDMILTPPKGVKEFKPGDSISFTAEWITVPREADDYYGPNEAFRKHLEKYPRSWQSVYREALGNDLKVQTAGGTVKNTYPVIIKATRNDDIQVKITGGIGAVPVRFEGLPSANYALYQVEGAKRTRLDQSVHGNDFWQTAFDPDTNTYSLTYNLPLDGLRTSGWVLMAEAAIQ